MAFIPGLFFEIFILISNPKLIATPPGLGYRSWLAVVLILAFIIGNGFMLLVFLIQLVLGYTYQLGRFVWGSFVRRVLFPRVGRILTNKNLPFRRVFARTYQYAGDFIFPTKLREVQRVWHRVAEELLARRYGIKPSDRDRGIDWGVWYSVLGKPRPEDLRGSLLTIAMHAAGWSGVAARHFSPTLNNSYYSRFMVLLIICGLIQGWRVAKVLHDPLVNGMMRVRWILNENRDLTADEKPDARADTPDVTMTDDE